MATKGMSEKRWLEGLDPDPMLDFLGDKISQRKLRLLACAACRYVWPHLVDERSRNAVEVAEHFADGLASVDELKKAYEQACRAYGDLDPTSGTDVCRAAAAVHNACWFEDFLDTAKRSLGCAVDVAMWQAALDVDTGKMAHAPDWELLVEKREKGKMARLVREVFGNPFKPVAIEPSWQTSSVTALAQSIYDDRAFDRLPELAGCLELGGCDCKILLDHCRDHRLHYRGCWVVDLVLGKT
jgi:hypothetical protein